MAEIKRVVNSAEDKWNDSKYPHLRGIQDGDVLVINRFDADKDYPKELLWAKGLFLLADDYMRWQMDSSDTVDVTINDEIPAERQEQVRANGYDGDFKVGFDVAVPFSVLSFRDKEPEVESAKPKMKNYSIHHDVQDEDIIKEMMAKVDRTRFAKLCQVAVGNGKKTSDEAIDILLRKWAEAKYDYYVAFGHQLIIRTPIEYTMDANEMRPMVYDLYKTYPQYAASIDKVVEAGGRDGIDYFTKNEMPKCDFYKTYAPDVYKKGMKISKFFSQLFQNKEFDIAFSKVMQNRMIKGFVCISIDPYDFMTSGTNMHGWSTCQKLYGSMNYGTVQWIWDPNALIAYRDNGKTYTYDRIVARQDGERDEYNFGKNQFEGNSKSWRQIINGDRMNCTFLFGREYPQHKDIEVVSEKARELLENTIGSYIGVTDWDNYGDLKRIHSEKYFGNKPVYVDVTNHHYSDIHEWESLKRSYPEIKKALISPANTDMSKVQVTAGGKLYCLCCGREIKNNAVFDGCQ